MSEAAAGDEALTGVTGLIDQLEEIISHGRRVPFSANVIVNEDDVLDLVDRIRLRLPEELVDARHTVEEREQILAAAADEVSARLEDVEHEAARRLEEAAAAARSLVAEHALIGAARERGEAVIRSADERASAIRIEAEEYARDVMERLDEQLGRAVATVRRGLETLPPRPHRTRRGPRG